MPDNDEIPPVPPAVTLHVWGVRSPTSGMRLMARRRREAGVTFSKRLGTGSGATFTARDADLSHWALLQCWASADQATEFATTATARSWDAIATERAEFVLHPQRSRGTWSGTKPFGDPTPTRYDGPIAAITRARIKATHWPAFWRSVPPVSTDAHAGGGLRFALGIGEAPIGLQGTFSVWESTRELNAFAYRRGAHQLAIAQTAKVGWYAEELFARFILVRASGRYRDRDVATIGEIDR